MFKRLKPQSEFAQNVLTLMTGTTIAQAIPIAISPILTRIYSPEEFGVFALFMSLVLILSIVASGRYEQAILLPIQDEDAIQITFLSIFLSLTISTILFILVLVFNKEITSILGNDDISNWLYWIPLSIFMTNIYLSLNFLNIRYKAYVSVSKSKVIQSSALSFSSVTAGYSIYNKSGLILGQIIGQLFGSLYLLFTTLKNDDIHLKQFKLNRLRILAKRYSEFPKIVTLTGLLNTSSVHAPILILTAFFSLKVIGFYSFSQRILSLPLGLIATSIGQVFYQELSKKEQIHEQADLLKSTVIKLLKIATPLFMSILFFGDVIFSLIFGAEWIVAGEYAKIMSIWLFFVFLISPLTQVFNILEKQRMFLKLNVLSFTLRIISLLIGGLYFQDILMTIYLFVASSVLSWLIILSVMLTLFRIKRQYIFILISKYILVYLTIFYLLNILLGELFV